MTISAKDLGDKVLSLKVGWIASARQPLLGERMPVRDRNLSTQNKPFQLFVGVWSLESGVWSLAGLRVPYS